ncbi:carboxylesterase family protein [Novosphingobium colocasiae]
MQQAAAGDAAPAGVPPAEDCLYANIWRPAGAVGKLPVIVWIYGGAFVNGGASSPVFSGESLARKGILFFSFNYRVGRFGTFAHPALTRVGADKGQLGNYGYMDQLAALRWVKRNIAAFGGDPDNVTLMGESAGGVSVLNWLTSPAGKGLFHKAVVMSGGDGTLLNGGYQLRTEEQAGLAFAATKGIAERGLHALTRLRALPSEAVVDGLNMHSMRGIVPRTYSPPFSDGKIAVPQLAALRRGAFARVPLIIGATSADIGGRTGIMIAGARQLAGIISGYGVPVYYYRFSYVAAAQGKPEDGARHATDVPYFLGNVTNRYTDKTTPRDVAVGDLISSYIVNFGKRASPNAPGLPPLARSRFRPRGNHGL